MAMKIMEEMGCPADIVELLAAHRRQMLQHSPEENVHALDNSGLQDSRLIFFSCREAGKLAGCGGLRILNEEEAELKSMRTVPQYLRQGVAGALLSYILYDAKGRGLQRIYLETGTAEVFAPALSLYRKQGFTDTGPFADYVASSHSLFLYKCL